MITAINSEIDYKAALREIEQLIDRNTRVGTPEGDRLISSRFSCRTMSRSGLKSKHRTRSTRSSSAWNK